MLTKTDLAKKAITIVVGLGTSKIINGIVKNNTAPEKVTDQVLITIGSYVIGAMISDATKKFTDARVDGIVAWWQKNITRKDAD